MKYKAIISSKDDKMTILSKAIDAGLDFRIACPDGLISMEKGIAITWYGSAQSVDDGEYSQFGLNLKNHSPETLCDDSPLIVFLKSLDSARPVSGINDKYYKANLSLVERGVFSGIFKS